MEDFDGSEVDEWRAHFARKPFTVDMIDFIGAHICQAVVASLGGKNHKIEKFLLIKRPKVKEDAEKSFRAALG